MINKLNNQSILIIMLTSAIIPLIIYYENNNDKHKIHKEKEYYIQWYIISFIISLFTITSLKEKTNIRNDINIGLLPNY